MKKYKSLSAFALLFMTLLLLNGCVKEDINECREPDPSSLILKLNIKGIRAEMPVATAASGTLSTEPGKSYKREMSGTDPENKVERIAVLFYNHNSKQLAYKATNVTEWNKKDHVFVIPIEEPNKGLFNGITYDIVVVANAKDTDLPEVGSLLDDLKSRVITKYI